MFSLGFEKAEVTGAQVQGLLVQTSCFRFEGPGSLLPEVAGYHQEHSVHSCTPPGQLSERRSQVPVTLPGPAVPQCLRHGTSLPSFPGGSFPPPPSVGTGWEEGIRGVHVFAFTCREQVGYIHTCGAG